MSWPYSYDHETLASLPCLDGACRVFTDQGGRGGGIKLITGAYLINSLRNRKSRKGFRTEVKLAM